MPRKPFGGRLLAACAMTLILVACSDPQVQKVTYLDSGNKLMADGKVPEAILAYKNAIKLDAKYGEARFQLARALEQRGDKTAGREYVRAADLLPDHFDAQLKAASVLVSTTQFEAAQKYADKALTLKPSSVEALIVRANALAGLKDIDAAVEQLERAAQSAPGDFRAYTNLAALQAAVGKPVEAEAAFKQAILTNPNAAEPKLAMAYFFMSTQRIPDAERVTQEVLRTDPGHLGANRMLSYLYVGTSRLADAEAPLLRLVNGKDPRATLMLGDLYMGTGRAKEARPLYESLLSQAANRDSLVARLATLDYREGRKAEAHARLDQRLGQPAPPADLFVLKAYFLTLDGQSKESLQVARKAVAVDPKSSQAQHWLGIAEEQNRNHDAALAAQTEALRLQPGMDAAEIALSRLLVTVGRSDEALQHAQAAQKAAPDSVAARAAVVRALLQKRQVPQAEAELLPLVQQFPKAATVHAMHGQVLLAKGDRNGAAVAFDKALAIDAANADALSGRIVVDLQAKRPNDARGRVDRALARRPGDSGVLIAAARLEATDHKPDAAENYLRQAIVADPANLAAYGLLAELYLKFNRLDDGKRELQKIVQQRKTATAALTMIGMIEQLQGKNDEAIKTYEAVLNESARAPIAANNLAYIYAERNSRIDEAMTLAQAAKAQLPNSHEISDTLGWVYVRKGLSVQAIQELEYAVSMSPQNPEYLYHLGLAYAKAGRPADAEKTLNNALRIKPDFPGSNDARQALAALKKPTTAQ